MSDEKTELDSILAEYDDIPVHNEQLSNFFEKQAAFGNAFVSTIDKNPDEIAAQSISETVNFVSNGKAPFIDSNGMIVIYDDEKGIDATSTVQLELAKLAFDDMKNGRAVRESTYTAADTSEKNFAPDDNISGGDSDDKDTHTEEKKGSKKSGKEKKSFGRRIRELFPEKGDSVVEVIRKIIFLAAGCVFIGAGVMLASTLIQSREAVSELEGIREMVMTTVATTINEQGQVETIPPTTEEREAHNESVMNSFVSVSNDVRGFIEIPGCDIYYPVVQGADNDYYLTHTYDNKTNKAGAIFIDHRCTISADYFSPNIVLYGHNQEDGTMFGNLKKYKNNVDFYKENPFVTFNTEFGLGDYVIFGYFVTNVFPKQDYYGEVFHYHDYIEQLSDEVTFDWYMSEVEERNQIIPTVDVEFGDQILVLSTCSNEYADSRFVVMCRRLRPGEEKSDFDFEGARINPNAKKIDWDAIMYGRTAPKTTPTESTLISITTSETESVTENETTSEEETTTKKKKKKKKKTETETTSESESGSEQSSESETVTGTVSETTVESVGEAVTITTETGSESETVSVTESEETTRTETSATEKTTKKTTAKTTAETTAKTTEKKKKSSTTTEETTAAETKATKKKTTAASAEATETESTESSAAETVTEVPADAGSDAE